MRKMLLIAVAGLVGVAGHAQASVPSDDRMIGGCISAAADVYRLPPAVLVILLNVEGGSLGRVSQNSNDTVDIGPMQVNQIWIPSVAAHWRATSGDTFRALRDDFCANLEAGAWILRQGLDEAHGDFWQGVGFYHSHDPELRATYLQAVLKQVLRLRATADKEAASRRLEPVGSGKPTPRLVLAVGN